MGGHSVVSVTPLPSDYEGLYDLCRQTAGRLLNQCALEILRSETPVHPGITQPLRYSNLRFLRVGAPRKVLLRFVSTPAVAITPGDFPRWSLGGGKFAYRVPVLPELAQLERVSLIKR